MFIFILVAAFLSVLAALSSPKSLLLVCGAWVFVGIVLLISVGSIGWWALFVALIAFLVGLSQFKGKG